MDTQDKYNLIQELKKEQEQEDKKFTQELLQYNNSTKTAKRWLIVGATLFFLSILAATKKCSQKNEETRPAHPQKVINQKPVLKNTSTEHIHN